MQTMSETTETTTTHAWHQEPDPLLVTCGSCGTHLVPHPVPKGWRGNLGELEDRADCPA